jgi:mRNA interferase MazF
VDVVSSVRREPRQAEVWLVALDPTKGSEIRKTRPCLVVSPDEMNQHIATVIVVPLTTSVRAYPTRIGIHFQGKTGQAALDQIRTDDQTRLVKKLGAVRAPRRTGWLASWSRCSPAGNRRVGRPGPLW